jgi:hypothetical protein
VTPVSRYVLAASVASLLRDAASEFRVEPPTGSPWRCHHDGIIGLFLIIAPPPLYLYLSPYRERYPAMLAENPISPCKQCSFRWQRRPADRGEPLDRGSNPQ